ncbi:MAG: hypothetical protein R6U04_12445 [Bacteroidales bacterium]
MKTLNKFILLTLIASVGFFTACEDDEDNNLSYEESQEVLQDMDSQTAADLEEMSQTDGMTAMMTLNTMDDPFAGVVKSTKEYQVISNIKELALPADKKLKTVKATDRFAFDDNAGTYTWNNTEGVWDYNESPTDEIVIVFPADSTQMDNNNATLTISNYQDTEIVDGEYSYYQPTEIKANLKVDDDEQMDMSFTASWDDNGNPISMDISVLLTPFNFTGNLEEESTSGSLNFSVDYNDSQILDAGVIVNFIEGTQDAEIIDGYIQYRKMRIEANINIANIYEIEQNYENYEDDQDVLDAINEEIDAKVFHDGDKVADLKVGMDDSTQEVIIVLVFNDGTEENAEEYFENLFTQTQEFLSEMGVQL